MRYYSLTITDPSTGQNVLLSPSGLGFTAGSGPLATSLYNSQTTNNTQLIGATNPNALNIEFDLPVVPLHIPQGNSLIRLWGVGLQALGQASDLNPVGDAFKTFSLSGGMAKGLPLANPSQANALAQGIVYQAFGNWTGTEQTLDIIVMGSAKQGSADDDGTFPDTPISFSWPKGTNLQLALSQMFRQAFPNYTPAINISANLIAPSDQKCVHLDESSFAQWLQQYTKRLGAQQYGASYQGVGIIPVGATLYASDGQGSTPAKTVPLAFQDLIGQPTWIKAYTITFSTTLRGDINWGDQVTFPTAVLPPYALTTPAAAFPGSPAASSSAFKGTFTITEVHHYANFRAADAASWNTTFTALSNAT